MFYNINNISFCDSKLILFSIYLLIGVYINFSLYNAYNKF